MNDQAGENVPGDHAGEQEGGEAGALGVRAQTGRLHPEHQTEHGGVNQELDQRLDQGPDPPQAAGAVAGGEVAAGKCPHECPLLVQGGEHAGWGPLAERPA